MKALPTIERVRQLLAYCPETGKFTWRLPTSNRKAGDPAGTLEPSQGYVRLSIDGEQYFAHRVAWFYVTGEWPPHDIDHRDRDRANNAFENLRPATRAENLQNQEDASPRSKTGIRGVQWDACRQKYRVEISVGNRNKFVGRFDLLEEACAARQAARRQYHAGAVL